MSFRQIDGVSRTYPEIVSQLKRAWAPRREPMRARASESRIHRGSQILRRRRSSRAAPATRCEDPPLRLTAARISPIDDIWRSGMSHTSGGRNERMISASARRSPAMEARRANLALRPCKRVGVVFVECRRTAVRGRESITSANDEHHAR